MSGIAGITNPNKKELVEKMLIKMNHRGWAWSELSETATSVVGFNGLKIQESALLEFKNHGLAKDGIVPGRFAQVQVTSKGPILQRDALGAAPMYYGWTDEGDFCFASEMKALILATRKIYEMPAGTILKDGKIEQYFHLENLPASSLSKEKIAKELRELLEASIEKCIGDGNIGSWLSGGLDSSIMAALAKKRVKNLHTFAAGLSGAPDLEFARLMAKHINADHHEIIVNLDEILAIIPEVIYFLETFDALLIRSSILNYMVARYASHFVPAVFSGEGGDELFAGYDYLKKISPRQLPDELIDIIGRLHNTALQRVDRCASTHGTLPHLGFLDPDLVNFAIQIPAEFKIRNGVEKWILREAVSDLLPPEILHRPKAKFWEGGGFEDLISTYANEKISDDEFRSERTIMNGSVINSKEELYYYRIFKQHYGDFEDISWMGRTKGAPIT